jgi:hypothetical protein
MSSEPQRWLDRPGNVTKIYRGLWAIGVFLVALDLLVLRHDELRFAESFAFYALYGFCGCVALVLAAKVLRRLVKRSEDYYER